MVSRSPLSFFFHVLRDIPHFSVILVQIFLQGFHEASYLRHFYASSTANFFRPISSPAFSAKDKMLIALSSGLNKKCSNSVIPLLKLYSMRTRSCAFRYHGAVASALILQRWSSSSASSSGGSDGCVLLGTDWKDVASMFVLDFLYCSCFKATLSPRFVEKENV